MSSLACARLVRGDSRPRRGQILRAKARRPPLYRELNEPPGVPGGRVTRVLPGCRASARYLVEVGLRKEAAQAEQHLVHPEGSRTAGHRSLFSCSLSQCSPNAPAVSAMSEDDAEAGVVM